MQLPPICVTRRIRIVSKVSSKPHSKSNPTFTSKPSPNKHNRFLEPAPQASPIHLQSDPQGLDPQSPPTPFLNHLHSSLVRWSPGEFSFGKTAQVHIGHASSRACTLALRRWGPADGHQTPGVMAHVQVMQAQGILHQALRWWGPASGHQTLGVMARVCKITKFWDKAWPW